ncbi:hypothetical protein [Flavobacterium chungbukense]|nr:hypothetical protein [Flavobacterium chungbukense]MCC4924037.1 hypothetical protein [Flavobacterium chungbukense]
MKLLNLFKKYWREKLEFKKISNSELSAMLSKESSLVVKAYFKEIK